MAEPLIAMVREAGAAIMEVYRRDFAVATKADGSPLTEADSRSHAILSARLARAFGLPVVSEEQPVAYEERRGWPELWLVDPLDGTRDFVARDDEFTVNVALVRGGEALLGVVYAPALDELYYGERGAGAFLLQGAARRRLPEGDRPPEQCMAVSRFHDSPASAAFARANGIAAARPIGSALKFGRLARGEVSIYPRFSGCSEWDIAAGQALVEAAGCRMVDLDTGLAPRYNKPDLRSGHFIACAPQVDFSALVLPGRPAPVQ